MTYFQAFYNTRIQEYYHLGHGRPVCTSYNNLELRVGDIGVFDHGGFCDVFNVFLPAKHPLQSPTRHRALRRKRGECDDEKEPLPLSPKDFRPFRLDPRIAEYYRDQGVLVPPTDEKSLRRCWCCREGLAEEHDVEECGEVVKWFNPPVASEEKGQSLP